MTLRNLLLWLTLALLAILSSNTLLSLMSVAVLCVGWLLLLRPKVSPILLFIFAYQWLQASTKLIRANLLGVHVDDLSQVGAPLSSAIFLSLFALMVLTFGLRYGAGPSRPNDADAMLEDAWAKPSLFWFKFYLAALVIATLAQAGARALPGLGQLLLALASLKWAAYWIFTYVTFTRTDGRPILWVIVFALELALGFGGYFSEFKTTLIMTILALVSGGLRTNALRLFGFMGVAALTLGLAIVWTAIKPDYRDFLSQGERAQVIYVNYAESVAYAASLIGKLDLSALEKAANDLAERIAYVEFFARTLDFVPATLPHEGGAIWGDALIRPFMPRLFFPNKSVINDSDRTSEFTGIMVATAEEGSSISIGYVGEAYIDFGPYFMMLPIFLLGLALGGFYKWISRYSTTRGLLGMGLATAILYPAAQFETSITKLIGGLAATFLVTWSFAKWVAPLVWGNSRRNLPFFKRS